jgi:hypothetical protein
VLRFDVECSKFFTMCVGDSFLADEIGGLRAFIEDLFADTPYEMRFHEVCESIKQHEP